MKGLFIFLFSSIISSVAAQSYVLDKDLSSVSFRIKNFGVVVKGEFQDEGGEFVLAEAGDASSFHGYVNAASINTGIGLRDKHLKGKDYFDVTRFPTIKIASSKIRNSEGQWSAFAWITIKEVTRAITVDFVLTKKHGGCTVKANFQLDRTHFGVGGTSLTLSDDVKVDLDLVWIEEPGH